MALPTIRIFVASPSDVKQERLALRGVMPRLEARFQSRVRLESLFWETEGYTADRVIQDQLPRPSDFDIVVLILWSTLGRSAYVDPVTQESFDSCTRFEINDVMRAPPERRPHLMVWRCTRDFAPSFKNQSITQIDELKREYDRTQQFLDHEIEACGVKATSPFERVEDFAPMVESKLDQLISEHLAKQGVAEWGDEQEEPYKGLRVLTEADSGYFFGRTRAMLRLVEQLKRQDQAGHPFVMVMGRGGVGKSSFVRAGVVPHIVHGGVIDGVSEWRKALFEPSDSTADLIGGLAAALMADDALPDLRTQADAFTKALREQPMAAAVAIRSELHRIRPGAGDRKPEARLLLLVDPAEEIFTRNSSSREIAEFARAIQALCESGLVWVIGTARSDFYHHLTDVEELRRLIDGRGQFNLPAMSLDEIRDAVSEPARRAGLTFGRSADGVDLATALVNAAVELQTDPMPLLAYALQQIHERSRIGSRRELSFTVYEQFGGLSGLLDSCADGARKRAENLMKGGQDEAWSEVFGRLVTVTESNQRVRLYARPELFVSANAMILLDELQKARLLIRDQDDQGKSVITIAHEAMLRHWKSLARWIESRDGLLKLSRTLAVAALEWDRNGRKADDLTLRDARLVAAEEFIANPHGLQVEPVVRDFIAAHVARREAEHRRRRIFLRSFVATICLALIVSSGLYWWSHKNLKQAVENLNTAANPAEFMMNVACSTLDRNKHRTEIKMIADEVVKFYLSDKGQNVAERVPGFGDRLKNAATALSSLSRYADAAKIVELAIEFEQRQGTSDAPAIAKLHQWAVDCYQRAGAVADKERHLTELESLLGSLPPAAAALVRSDFALQLRYEGRYVEAVHEFREIVKEIDALQLTGRDAFRIYNGFTESLRYAGYVEEGFDVYRGCMQAAERRNEKIDPEYQVEYSVFLGYSRDPELINDAEDRILAAIESEKRAEDRAQFQYKLARILIDANRLDEAEPFVAQSMSRLANSDNARRKAKCLEVRARLYLKKGRKDEALEDARRVIELRDEIYAKGGSKLHREYLDACVLLTDCERAVGGDEAAAQSQARETEIRQQLFEREGEAAKRLGERPPDFSRREVNAKSGA
jgi:tetratricopeptide (TPR) repeat protein